MDLVRRPEPRDFTKRTAEDWLRGTLDEARRGPAAVIRVRASYAAGEGSVPKSGKVRSVSMVDEKASLIDASAPASAGTTNGLGAVWSRRQALRIIEVG